MKKFVLSLTLCLAAMSFSFASSPCLAKEIQQKFSVDFSDIELDQYQEDFVVVNFKVVNGEISILAIGGTQSVLEELVIEELKEMKIESTCGIQDVHSYKFTFKKI